jgi:hypothetical protein
VRTAESSGWRVCRALPDCSRNSLDRSPAWASGRRACAAGASQPSQGPGGAPGRGSLIRRTIAVGALFFTKQIPTQQPGTPAAVKGAASRSTIAPTAASPIVEREPELVQGDRTGQGTWLMRVAGLSLRADPPAAQTGPGGNADALTGAAKRRMRTDHIGEHEGFRWIGLALAGDRPLG